jgi:hypothetical protein
MQPVSNAITMWSVPADIRPFALAVSEALQHMLGGIPAPPIFGAIQEAVNDWRLTMALVGVLAVVSSACYGGAAWAARSAVDYRQVGTALGGDSPGMEGDGEWEGGVGGGHEGVQDSGRESERSLGWDELKEAA